MVALQEKSDEYNTGKYSILFYFFFDQPQPFCHFSSRVSSIKLQKYLAMQTVLVLFVQVFTYLSMRLLFPHQYNGGEWNLICDAHTIEN